MTKNNDRNNERDLFDELRAANPFMEEGTNPQTMTSSEARFEEITMQPHETHTAPRKSPAAAPAPWWRRPMIAAPTAIALVAVLAVGALIASTINAPSALALVTAAAQKSAQFDSGRVDIEIEFREDDEMMEPGVIKLTHRYEGSNYEFSQEFNEVETGGSFAIRTVDGTTYSHFPELTDEGQSWFVSQEESAEIWEDIGLAVDPASISPDSVVELIKLSDDFDEIESNDGVKTFRGSVPSSVVVEVSPEQLPPGLSLLASSGTTSDLPETLTISVEVRDETLETITVDIVGDTDDGFTDATMVSTFSDLGVPQNIEAPSPDQISDSPDFDFAVSPELEESLEIMEELDERRPELCNEAFADFSDPTNTDFENIDVDEQMAEMAAVTENFAQCLEDEGEPAAAEAFRSMMTDFDS